MENDNKTKQFNRTLLDTFIILSDVILFSSALNCLFQTLSYGKTFDIVLFVISLVLGLIVYYFALNVKKVPLIQKRLIIAVSCVIVWALLIPVLYSSLH